LKKDAKIFLAIHFGGEIRFSNLLKWKNFKLWCATTQACKHIGESKYVIQMTHHVFKMALKCQKNSEKVTKNTFKAQPPSTKMLLSHS